VIPRKGRPTKARQAAEHRRAFRRTVKWRTGCEGRISTLKRGYGWDRTRSGGDGDHAKEVHDLDLHVYRNPAQHMRPSAVPRMISSTIAGDQISGKSPSASGSGTAAAATTANPVNERS
jgi:IS5 family transposase